MHHRILPVLLSLAALLPIWGCRTHHQIGTTHMVEVKPIEINLNIRLQIQRDVEDFFADLDNQDPTLRH